MLDQKEFFIALFDLKVKPEYATYLKHILKTRFIIAFRLLPSIFILITLWMQFFNEKQWYNYLKYCIKISKQLLQYCEICAPQWLRNIWGSIYHCCEAEKIHQNVFLSFYDWENNLLSCDIQFPIIITRSRYVL